MKDRSCNEKYFDDCATGHFSVDRLVLENQSVRRELMELNENGVRLSACRTCAENLLVAEKMKEIGVEIKYWGEPLTRVLKSGARLITI